MPAIYGTVSICYHVDREDPEVIFKEMVEEINVRFKQTYGGAVLVSVRDDDDAEQEWNNAVKYRGLSPTLARIHGARDAEEGDHIRELRRTASMVEWNRRIHSGHIPDEVRDEAISCASTQGSAAFDTEKYLAEQGWVNPY